MNTIITSELPKVTDCLKETFNVYQERDKENVNQRNICKQMNNSYVSEEARLKTNVRERQRMHQMNKGMEDLKQVLPYSKSVNKLSKMSTLLLAREHIVSLQKSQKELHHLVQKLQNNLSRQSHNASLMCMSTEPASHDIPIMCISTKRSPHSVSNQGLYIYKDYQIDTQTRGNFMAEQPRRKLQDITNTKGQGHVRPKVLHKFSIDALLSDC
ncbi:oligodendrocyte transcription factor 2-like [Mytilus trossulus]|uniref:oligodendrocyte transcription factor 2-like n=1 Tax=Mytilus trossulus TaxID=6551 RepID=UPI003003DCF9